MEYPVAQAEELTLIRFWLLWHRLNFKCPVSHPIRHLAYFLLAPCVGLVENYVDLGRKGGNLLKILGHVAPSWVLLHAAGGVVQNS